MNNHERASFFGVRRLVAAFYGSLPKSLAFAVSCYIGAKAATSRRTPNLAHPGLATQSRIGFIRAVSCEFVDRSCPGGDLKAFNGAKGAGATKSPRLCRRTVR